MKIGKNTGRYALGILGGLATGNPLGGLRTMLAIQQERGQRKHQEKIVDKLVAGLSQNASGGSPGQTFKAPKGWNKDTLKSPTGKPQDPPTQQLPQAMTNREQLIAGERKMPQHVFDSIQRQYKGGKDYTIEDKKNVINWYKLQQA